MSMISFISFRSPIEDSCLIFLLLIHLYSYYTINSILEWEILFSDGRILVSKVVQIIFVNRMFIMDIYEETRALSLRRLNYARDHALAQ